MLSRFAHAREHRPFTTFLNLYVPEKLGRTPFLNTTDNLLYILAGQLAFHANGISHAQITDECEKSSSYDEQAFGRSRTHGLTKKSTDERLARMLEGQMDVTAAHSVPRLVGDESLPR